jgi:hypothetical protein
VERGCKRLGGKGERRGGGVRWRIEDYDATPLGCDESVGEGEGSFFDYDWLGSKSIEKHRVGRTRRRADAHGTVLETRHIKNEVQDWIQCHRRGFNNQMHQQLILETSSRSHPYSTQQS